MAPDVGNRSGKSVRACVLGVLVTGHSVKNNRVLERLFPKLWVILQVNGALHLPDGARQHK